MFQKILTAAVIMGSLLSCGSDSQDDKSSGEYSINDPFPTNECTALVIYATKSLDDNPDNTYPSLVHANYDNTKSGLVADKAPYLTVLTDNDMLLEISRWKTNAITSEDLEQAKATEEWVKNKIAEGWSNFMYETEPPKFAGNAYPWAIYDEQN